MTYEQWQQENPTCTKRQYWSAYMTGFEQGRAEQREVDAVICHQVDEQFSDTTPLVSQGAEECECRIRDAGKGGGGGA